MAVESKADRARREAAEKGGARKLDPVHKAFLYISAGILTVGKLIYSVGLFNIQALDAKGKECFYIPSNFDSNFDDVVSAAAIVFVVSLYTALNYLENK